KEAAMAVDHVNPAGLARNPYYSHVVKVGSLAFLSGQVSRNEQGVFVGAGDFAAQATQAFENVQTALRGVGASMQDVVKVTVYLTDRATAPTLREVRARFLQEPMPASTFVIVAGLLDPDAMIEIDVVAAIPT